MNTYPYVILKCAVSLDSYLDNVSEERLLLSNAEDFARVEEVRASCDAILVGANTIRKDNPQLLIKSKMLQQNRIEKGLPPQPIKITLTKSGNIDSSCAFFTKGESEKIVYTTSPQEKMLREQLGLVATIIGLDEKIIHLPHLLSDLYKRGIRRLLVEGGSYLTTQFLQQGLVDELQLSIAGFFVGEEKAPRFVQPSKFPWNTEHRMHLQSVEMLGGVAVLKWKT